MNLQNECTKRLGFPGALLSQSKSGYAQRHPDNLVVFNANVCLDNEKQWFGDIDVTKQREALVSLARETGMTVHVLRESDGRFENEMRPLISKAVYSVNPEGKETFR